MSALPGSLFSDVEVQKVLSTEQFVRYMLHVEQALATAEGIVGVIPEQAATQIKEAISSFTPDYENIKQGMERSGVPVIALIKQLRGYVGGDAASYVHWGATSQDIIDTTLVLQIRDVLLILDDLLLKLIRNLTGLADAHRHTLMAGRTHSQQAIPVPFGFKVAGWLAPIIRHYQRMDAIRARTLVLQFGGAAGTLASLGRQGTAVERELANLLELGIPLMPWHTGRDNLAALAGWLSMVTGSLGKMAQDIILMAQSEVGELYETDDPGQGGSSTMPQKRNPIKSELIVTAARQNVSLLSSMHHAMIQEHERATHGWQLEWITLPQMLIIASFAIRKAEAISGSLVVKPDRMQENIDRSNGVIYAEAIGFALSDMMGRNKALQTVREAAIVASNSQRNLLDVIKDQIGDTVAINWDQFSDAQTYMGSSQIFIDRIIDEANGL